jgi:hypothetical protein
LGGGPHERRGNMVRLPKKKKAKAKTKGKKEKKPRGRKERRIAKREPGRVFACILEEHEHGQMDQAFCVVMDVSQTGMRLRTPQPPINGTNVTLRSARTSATSPVTWYAWKKSGHLSSTSACSCFWTS